MSMPPDAKTLLDGLTQPAPWTVNEYDHGRCVVLDANGCWVADVGEAPADAAFIAAAPTLVEELLTARDGSRVAIDALHAANAAMRAEFEALAPIVNVLRNWDWATIRQDGGVLNDLCNEQVVDAFVRAEAAWKVDGR